MSLVVRVAGGTDGGNKRPMQPPRTEPWTCSCGQVNKPSWTRCFTPGCNLSRP